MMNGMGRLGLVVVLGASIASTARADDRPAPDTGTGPAAVPAVPAFELHVPSANTLGVQQLRALGRRAYDGKPVVVRGFVTSVYDCVDENLEPDKTRAQLSKELAADPKRCEAPKLYLGDTKSTPRDLSLPVGNLPAKMSWKAGDYLEIAGTFTSGSRTGLVALASAKLVKPEAGTKVQLPAARTLPALRSPTPLRASPPPGQKMRAIMAALRDARQHAEWLVWSDAQAEYRRIVATWDGFDVAWYELGTVYAAPGMLSEAADAFGKAFALVPTQPVYAYRYGQTLFLRDVLRARQAEAKRLGIHEEYVELSAAEAKLALDKPQQLLEYAISLAPEQWAAHAAVAAIYAANGDDKRAAEAWTAAIARGPKDYQPYWELGRLYHEWGYDDAAIAVAQAWLKVRSPDEISDRMYVLAATAYEAKGDLGKAIEMLSLALAQPGSASTADAALYRARLYIATKQYDKARLDLAPFPTRNKSKMREVNVLLSKIPAPRKKR